MDRASEHIHPSQKSGCWNPLELFCDFHVTEALPQVCLSDVVAEERGDFCKRWLGVEQVEGTYSDLTAVPRRLPANDFSQVDRQLGVDDGLCGDRPAHGGP